MGAVYRARHSTGRQDAVKVINPRFAGDEAGRSVERFRREMDALFRTRAHPGIVRIYEAGVDQGRPWLAMEYVRGEPLAAILVRDGPYPPREAARLVAACARAIQFAHEAGVIHRDLKSENVLIDPVGRPRLLDFGLAFDVTATHLTRTGELLGTPMWMAPEQLDSPDDRRLGATTDVYGLGGLLYVTLTARTPFKPQETTRVILDVIKTEPVALHRHRPGIDAALEAICLRALSKGPEARQRSAIAFAEALEGWLAATDPARGDGSSSNAGDGPSYAGGPLSRMEGAADLTSPTAEWAPPPSDARPRRDTAVASAPTVPIAPPSGEAPAATPARPPSRPLTRRRGLGGLVAVGFVVVVVAAVVLVVVYGRRTSSPTPVGPPGPSDEELLGRAAAVARGELAPPADAEAFARLYDLPGLAEPLRGALLLRRGEAAIAASPPRPEEAIDAFVTAGERHGVDADASRFPPVLVDALGAAFVAATERDVERARAILSLQQRAPAGAITPTPSEIARLHGLIRAARPDRAREGAAGEADLERAILVAAFLEPFGASPLGFFEVAEHWRRVDEAAVVARADAEVARRPALRSPAVLLLLARLVARHDTRALDEEAYRQWRSRAEPWVRAALASEVEAAWVQTIAAYVLEKLGRFDDALTALERAAALEEPNAVPWPLLSERLADVLIDRDEPRAARVGADLARAARAALRAVERQREAKPFVTALARAGADRAWALDRAGEVIGEVEDVARALASLGRPACCEVPVEHEAPTSFDLLAAGIKLADEMAFHGSEAQLVAFRLARHHEAHGRSSEALDAFAVAIRFARTAPVDVAQVAMYHFERAELFRRIGRPRDAVADFDTIVETIEAATGPDGRVEDATFWLGLSLERRGLAHDRLGQPDLAIDDLGRAIEVSAPLAELEGPSRFLYRSNLAIFRRERAGLLESRDRLEEATAELDAALALLEATRPGPRGRGDERKLLRERITVLERRAEIALRDTRLAAAAADAAAVLQLESELEALGDD